MKKEMNTTKIIKGYLAEISYDEDDHIYVVLFPALVGLGAHGDTISEALLEAEVAIRMYLQDTKLKGLSLPAPLPTIKDLKAWSGLFNQAALARGMGVNHSTLKSKIQNGTDLSPKEALAAQRVLESLHLQKLS